jgi:hypothetical protein
VDQQERQWRVSSEAIWPVGTATPPHTLEEWAEWVSLTMRLETGLTLSKRQEMLIIIGFFYMLRRRGFDMSFQGDPAPK